MQFSRYILLIISWMIIASDKFFFKSQKDLPYLIQWSSRPFIYVNSLYIIDQLFTPVGLYFLY